MYKWLDKWLVWANTPTKPVPVESEADKAIKRVIDIIINEFNGDTTACFESIRSKRPEKELAPWRSLR